MFKRSQAILKIFLSEQGFKRAYSIAWSLYLKWVDFKDKMHFGTGNILALLTSKEEKIVQMQIMRKIKPYTMVGRSGMYVTYDSVVKVEKENISGAIVECGVARGGSSAMMALASEHFNGNRHYWLFDTFEGLPPPSDKDDYIEPVYESDDKHAGRVSEGYCLGTIEEVENLLFSNLKLPREKFTLVKGLFQDTLSDQKDKIGDISVLRLDGDWYDSTMCCLENLWDNVSQGGVVIMDDYVSVPSCKKATHDFLDCRKINVDIELDERGGAYFLKPY
ncbi:TylF/MycF family methyltransferase [Alphaproteobacteria bacterium]|nr:TylF/MycF family methyltransferase [Alphaproteobacteria bacterium]